MDSPILLVEGGLFFRHDLEIECPTGKFASGDSIEQIPLMTFTVVCDDSGRFFIAQILDALLGSPMIFHPYSSAFRIDEAIGM